MQQFCVPVNLTGYHWIVMDVIMPNIAHFNGKILLTNHAVDDKIAVAEQYRSSKVKYSLMWWAKWFGMYHKEIATKSIVEAHHD